MTTSGTQPKYTVDIWSGNHPFFKGSSSTVVVDEGRVNRFKRRYAGLDTMADMSTMKQGAYANVAPLSPRSWASCSAHCAVASLQFLRMATIFCRAVDITWYSGTGCQPLGRPPTMH
jgi:Ribosomal protein L31